MNTKKIFTIPIIAILIFTITIFSSEENRNSDFIKEEVTTTAAASAETTVITTMTEPDPVVRVFAAGDNLIHAAIYNQAKSRSTNGGYDFDYAYQHVADLVEPADLAILNQETPIANDLFAPSDYPLFNSPTQLGDKMIDMGFNVISHSNNHILDKGEKGLLATLDYWDSRNMLVYGAYRDEEDLNTIPTMNINGINFSFLGFMEHTNGLYLPENSKAELVYTSEIETMQRLIKSANDISDTVVVSVHWGTEISNTITDQQRNLAKLFVEWGADVIIGTQPHTVQSMEYLNKPDGGQAFVAYSLGNFISAQERNLAMIGVTVDFNVTKNLKTGMISIKDIKAVPVISHYGSDYSNVTVYPYNQYNQELANSHGVRARGEFSMDYINKILIDNIPKEFLRLE